MEYDESNTNEFKGLIITRIVQSGTDNLKQYDCLIQFEMFDIDKFTCNCEDAGYLDNKGYCKHVAALILRAFHLNIT